MNKFFLFLLILSSNFLSAQSPTIIWEKTLGGSKNDEAHQVILTSDNHYLLIGYTQPEGRYDLDLFIAKINSNGDVVWKKNYGTDQVEIGYDIAEDANGDFIAVGLANHATRSSEIWVLKIDKSGQQLWERKYGLKNSDAGRSVFITKDARIIIGGEQEGEATGVNHALWLVLDKNGNRIKENTYGGDYFFKTQKEEDRAMFGVQKVKGESCNKLIASKNGGFLFVGYTITKAKEDLATDGWVVKLDEAGQLVWDKALGAVGGDNILDIMENDKGEIFTVGTYYDKFNGKISIWLTKLDTNGNLIFEKQFGDKDFSAGKVGVLLGNDEIIMSGFTSGSAPTNLQTINTDTISKQRYDELLFDGWQEFYHKGSDGEEWKISLKKILPLTEEQQKIRTDRDAWLGKADASGNLIWKKTLGGIDDDEAFSMIKDEKGNLIVVGYTRSQGKGLKDIWILKLGNP